MMWHADDVKISHVEGNVNKYILEILGRAYGGKVSGPQIMDGWDANTSKTRETTTHHLKGSISFQTGYMYSALTEIEAIEPDRKEQCAGCTSEQVRMVHDLHNMMGRPSVRDLSRMMDRGMICRHLIPHDDVVPHLEVILSTEMRYQNRRALSSESGRRPRKYRKIGALSGE